MISRRLFPLSLARSTMMPSSVLREASSLVAIAPPFVPPAAPRVKSTLAPTPMITDAGLRDCPISTPGPSDGMSDPLHFDLDCWVAARAQRDSIDIITRQKQRLRAQLNRGCRALDFYAGFYMQGSKDGRLCEDRDEIHARTGAKCEIDKFRLMVPVRDDDD